MSVLLNNSNSVAYFSVHSGLDTFTRSILRFSLELRRDIPPEVFRGVTGGFGGLVRVSPAFVKTLVGKLIFGKNWFARRVASRFVKKIEYTRVPVLEFSRYCPQENPNLVQFSHVIASRFVPFLRGGMSLSLTQIFEILCFLTYHLKTARSKMQDYSVMLNVDGRFNEGYCSDEYFSDDEDCSSSNRPSIEHTEFVLAKEAIIHIDHFLEYVEPAMPICLRIFERYRDKLLNFP